MPRYIIVSEDSAGDCEWETFINGWECFNLSRFAIVDTHGDKMDKPDGFHVAHGCYRHALFMLELTETPNA
jgi:hypothetical protein